MLFSLFLLLLPLSSGEVQIISIIRNSPWQHEVINSFHPDAILDSTFNNTFNETGWSTLEIHAKHGVVPDDELAYVAGYVEGMQTGELIYMMYKNTFGDDICPPDSKSNFCNQLLQFIDDNQIFMKEEIKRNHGSSYWYQIHLYLKQLEGLEDGYYSNKTLPKLPKNAFLYLQIKNDLGNLKEIFKSDSYSRVKLDNGRCSALIKVLPDNADLLTSHDTWTEYQTMLRIFKLYDLPFNNFNDSGHKVAGSAISMSSYPGKLQSEDDYYIINSGLVTMETTNGNFNPVLWNDITPACVFEPLRVMVSNRLASSGREWTQIFAQYNSGTYNNQWMIVDYKLFEPHNPLPSSDLLWILEQLPGYIMFGDETRVLVNNTYWASYNIPYYSSIYRVSGLPQWVDKFGDYFSHDGTPRAKIFARDHTKVTDMDSFIQLMRYNDFKHDPLSACNCTPPYSGENAISARSDLNPKDGTYPFPELGHRCHGGTDNKATSFEMVQQLSCYATCGPTHQQQPVFEWSTSGYSQPLGHPDKFDFPTVTIQWNK